MANMSNIEAFKYIKINTYLPVVLVLHCGMVATGGAAPRLSDPSREREKGRFASEQSLTPEPLPHARACHCRSLGPRLFALCAAEPPLLSRRHRRRLHRKGA